MENNILPTTLPPASPPPPSGKIKISAIGVILTIILSIVLITLGERIIFDLNKSLNPYVVKSEKTTTGPTYSGGLQLESSRLSNQKIYYEQAKSDKYLNFKVLINSGFIIPIFMLTFLIYYIFTIKRRDSNLRIVSYGYLIFAFWMIIHLVINVIQLAYREFPQLALYIILIFFAIIFTVLAIFIQKKVNQHKHQ